jgi:hypothetical protein
MSASSLGAVGLAACLSLGFCGLSTASAPQPARASAPQFTVGNILLCDKPEQVEAFFASAKASAQVAVSPTPTASCGLVTAVFRTETAGKTILLSNGILHVVKIEMVGMRASDSWVKMSKPFTGFAGVLEAATIA